MPKAKTDTVDIIILADGVFVDADKRCDKQEVVSVPADIADKLVKSGHAKRK